MKRIMLLATIAASLCGCAHLTSTTQSSMPIVDSGGKTNWVTQSTKMTIYTVFDASSQLAKAANQSSQSGNSNNTYAPGTHLSGLNQSSTASNLPAIFGAMSEGIVKGMK